VPQPESVPNLSGFVIDSGYSFSRLQIRYTSGLFIPLMRTGADIHLMIKRSEFGVNYGLPALADEVDLTIGIRK
jgi:polyisoprenoid-binding protein YceI